MSNGVTLESDGETVNIQDLTIKDEDVHSFFDNLEEDEIEDSVKSALKIGVIGIKRVSTGTEVDYVEKEFDRVVDRIDEMFDPEIRTSYFGRLEETLEDYFEEGGTVEEILDPSDKSTPVGKLKEDIMDELKKMREEIAGEEAREEIKERTPLKGEDFEDFCERILGEKVCPSLGDELFRTTDEGGDITDCKKGDFVAKPKDLDGKKIVFEMKSGKINQRKILEEELPEAIENRSADYGILVSKYVENLPNKIGWFNEYRGNMLVCAVGNQEDEYFPSLLNVAYQYSKQRLREKEISEAEVDVEKIRTGIENIGQKIDKTSNLKRKATNIDKATDEIRNLSNEIRNEINEELESMSQAIS